MVHLTFNENQFKTFCPPVKTNYYSLAKNINDAPVWNTVTEWYSRPLPVVLIIKSNSVFQKLQLFHIFWCISFVSFCAESCAWFIFPESNLFEINKQTNIMASNSWKKLCSTAKKSKAGKSVSYYMYFFHH